MTPITLCTHKSGKKKKKHVSWHKEKLAYIDALLHKQVFTVYIHINICIQNKFIYLCGN